MCQHCSRPWDYVSERGSQDFCPKGTCNMRAYLKLPCRKAIHMIKVRIPGFKSYLYHLLAVTSQQVSGNKTSHGDAVRASTTHPCVPLCVFGKGISLGRGVHKETLLPWGWWGPISGLGIQPSVYFSGWIPCANTWKAPRIVPGT